MRELQRMFVNQSSTLQPYHRLHGVHVLADYDTARVDDKIITVYFLEGSVISQRMCRNALDKGWN